MRGAFISPKSNNKAGCDMCRRSARRLVKHLRFNHNTEYDEVSQLCFKEEEEKGAAKGENRLQSPSPLALTGTIQVYRERERECVATGNVHRRRWPWEIDSPPSRLQLECWCSNKGSSAQIQNTFLLSVRTLYEYRMLSAIPAQV